jgi:hypothetical protein
VFETSIDGAWTDPLEAVKCYFHRDIEESEDGKIGLYFHSTERFSPEELVERMLDPSSDYPVLVKVPVNPKDKKGVWDMDR